MIRGEDVQDVFTLHDYETGTVDKPPRLVGGAVVHFERFLEKVVVYSGKLAVWRLPEPFDGTGESIPRRCPRQTLLSRNTPSRLRIARLGVAVQVVVEVLRQIGNAGRHRQFVQPIHGILFHGWGLRLDGHDFHNHSVGGAFITL